MPVKYHNYLDVHIEQKKNEPLETFTRRFIDSLQVDLTTGYIDSKAIKRYSALESSIYKGGNYKASELANDSLLAGRI